MNHKARHTLSTLNHVLLKVAMLLSDKYGKPSKDLTIVEVETA